ncbi:DNA polymerase theta [Anopheles maculipalpis]|uniref:DNA polymerase theta n=1 Tax=Anopheles maculipalpis TaxID=1496333 RepID=UPI00215943F6|nr:DNA polymerase theta [Anopheles maculipalpis]
MFSQSLQLGDNTFDALERQHTKAHTTPTTQRTITRSQRAITIKQQQQQSSTEPEVIEKSPTNAKCPAEMSRQRSVRERLQIISTQARGRKTKNRTVRSTTSNAGQRSHASEHPSNSKKENLSELFSSDIQFDVGGQSSQKNALKRTRGSQEIGLNDDGRPSPEKQPSQYDDLFQNSAFSMNTVRSQSIAMLATAANQSVPKDGSFYTLFDQSDFTLDKVDGRPELVDDQPPIPAIMTESELEIFSETLFDRAISSEPAMNDLFDDSDLIESLRVDSADDTVEDAAIDIENVTFSQPLVLASIALGQQQTSERSFRQEPDDRNTEMYAFIESEMEHSLRFSREASEGMLYNVPNRHDESGSFSVRSGGLKNVTKESTTVVPLKQTLANSMSLDATKDLRLIDSWGLPNSVTREYAKKGIVQLFPWQVECLSRKEVMLEGKNLIYTAPTSAGKTLVSEFLLIKTIAERKLKALLILPFVAVAREKMLYLKDLLEPGGMRVEGFYGGYNPPGGFESVDVAVCTIEKANSIVNRLLEQRALTTLGIVVVDEAHLISDPSRGYILELLLTKIRFVADRTNHLLQIVCMSATLPNMHLLAQWLEADLYRTDFRPIALFEMIKIGSTIYDATGEQVRSLDGITLLGYSIPKDADHVALLCLETILEGCAVIVFCPSKDWCEQLAISLASTVHTVRKRDVRLSAQVDGVRQEEVLLQLRSCPAGLDSVLEKIVPYGIAFHHAGLTTDERDIVESAFRDGAIRIIVATSTLSSGVNLPARRVIIRTPKFGGRPMSALTYKQMIGRAGRQGHDTVGESILVCGAAEEKIGRELIGIELPPVRSCLDSDNYAYLKRAVLEIIASGSATTSQDLESFVNATLHSCERGDRFIVHDDHLRKKSNKAPKPDDDDGKASEDIDPIAACISFLVEYEFIRLSEQENPDGPGLRTVLTATRLGHACLAASLPPKDGLLLFSELQRARQCFVLESELHAIYLVTPYSVAYQWQQIDWMDFLDLWEKLPAASKRVGELVGVKESFMVRAMRGGSAHLDYRSLQIHKRFYTALALLELVREVPLGTVARQFKCCRGLLQSLQQVSATFAGIVASFCASLNWTLLQLLVAQFRERLFFGVAHELLDLMRIPSLNGQRARLLYDGGIVGLVQLANADRFTVETILHNRTSFEMERVRDDEDKYEAERRKRLRNLHLTGRSGVTVEEAARLLIQEARTYVQLEHGLANPSWSQDAVGHAEEADRTPEMEKQSPSTGATVVLQSEEQTSSLLLLSDGGESSSTTGRQFHNSLLMRNDGATTTDDDDPITHLKIIDVCKERTVYDQFCKTVAEQGSITIAFGVEQEDIHCHGGRGPPSIGAHLRKLERMPKTCERSYTFDDNLYLAGLGVTMKDTSSTVYYIDLQHDTVVDSAEKVRFVRTLFSREQLTIALLDTKDQLKIVYRSGILPVAEGDQMMVATMQDPRVACWLLQTDAETLTLDAMIERHCPTLKKRTELMKIGQQRWITPKWTGHALNYHSPIDARQRCAVECLIVRELMAAVSERLAASGGNSLPICFTTREMPVQVALARAEVIGFPVDRERLGALIARLKACRDRIADEARKLNGNRRLDFGSSRAVAKALQLASGTGQKKCRTVRQVLERLDSPLAALVIAHRKIESNLSRTIEPLHRVIRPGFDRVHGRSFCFTSTGRITMHEPNLQTVVKDFTVPSGLGPEFDGECRLFSCRGTFVCADPDRTVLLSADFCQLELCILTHLSQDRQLMAALGSTDGEAGGQTARKDVFRALAARWNQLERESDVSEELRNRTKAIVYGVIYGMGVRAMAAELQLDEDAARTLMEQFHATYPEIRRYIERVVRLTRQLGYIETLTGRRRHLPAISSANARERAEAERQAVCTTIQGSAADILKNAIVRMGRNLGKYRNVLELSEIRLVLHMHDELIYEVPRNQLAKVAKLLKSSMENCAKLSVPLRVKLKAGPSWGTLQELTTFGRKA